MENKHFRSKSESLNLAKLLQTVQCGGTVTWTNLDCAKGVGDVSMSGPNPTFLSFICPYSSSGEELMFVNDDVVHLYLFYDGNRCRAFDVTLVNNTTRFGCLDPFKPLLKAILSMFCIILKEGSAPPGPDLFDTH